MRFFTSALLTATAAAVAVAQSTLTINTPTALFTCDPYLLTWSGGTAPYTIRVFPSGDLGATPLETLVSGTSATSLTWTVNLPSGTGVTMGITDSTGSTIGSAPVTIQAGTSTSCIGSSSSGAAASTGSQGATSAQSMSATSVATTLSSVSSASSTGAAAGAASRASSAVSSASSAASSAAESVSSRVSTATGAASSVAASAKPSSGASTLAVSGGLGLVGAAIAIFA